MRALLLVGLLVSGASLAFGQIHEPQKAPPVSEAKPLALPESVLATPVTGDIASTDQNLLNSDKNIDDWLLHGRTYDNQRFSPLSQITKDNISRLTIKAMIHTGVINNLEATPIVVDGIMYLSAAGNHVQAYDAATGEFKWSYNPTLGYAENCCGPQSRGVAVAYGKVFVAQLDGRVAALDAKTGTLIWRTEVANTVPAPTHFYLFSMAPQVFNGMVLVGNSGAEYPTRGFVEALDANTGQLIWRFRTTAAPGEPGEKTWSEDSWRYGGGSVWNTPAVDPKNNLIIFATGNPNPDIWGEHHRKGDNAYTDSIVAIDSRTGKLSWWYQQVAHDVWDYDCAAPVILFDYKDERGNIVPAAAEAGKIGNVFIVNRLTGKLLRKSQPFVKQSDNMFGMPGEKSFIRYPGVFGGSLWSPASYSPLTQYFYVMGVNEAFTIKATPIVQYAPGTPIVGQYLGGMQAIASNDQYPTDGTFTAIDVVTGKIAWQKKTELPMYGGVLTTASNLVFTGEMTGFVDAFDAVTGEKVWSHNLGIGVCTPPVTYRVKGVQYLAVGASGCGISGGLLKDPNKSRYSDSIAIYALAK